jgi:hypothetical protein
MIDLCRKTFRQAGKSAITHPALVASRLKSPKSAAGNLMLIRSSRPPLSWRARNAACCSAEDYS